jgi:hypothetical protein
MAFPLVASAAEPTSAARSHVNSQASVKHVHVDEDESDEDHDHDLYGYGRAGGVDYSQHSPGLFLDHSASHPLTLGLGTWSVPGGPPVPSSSQRPRQHPSPRREHGASDPQQEGSDDALSPRSEEGMQVLAAARGSGAHGGGGGRSGRGSSAAHDAAAHKVYVPGTSPTARHGGGGGGGPGYASAPGGGAGPRSPPPTSSRGSEADDAGCVVS